MAATLRALALAGAFLFVAAPCLGQALNLNPYGLELDPYRVFPPGPAIEPSPPLSRHGSRRHRRRTHHVVSRHAMRRAAANASGTPA